jgi:Planctomycete cytochrome C.
MKKTILPAIALLTIFIIAACGGGTSSPDTAPQTPPEPATPTETLPQPTDTPAPAETEAPVEETAASGVEAPVSATVSFANDVMPILQNRCVDCHGGRQKKEGLDMKTHENLMAGSRNGSVVTPGNAGASLLVELIVKGDMPNRGDPVTPDELQLIMDWVNQGALNN